MKQIDIIIFRWLLSKTYAHVIVEKRILFHNNIFKKLINLKCYLRTVIFASKIIGFLFSKYLFNTIIHLFLDYFSIF